MNNLLIGFICIVIAYLVGSIPTGMILGKIWNKKDIRQYGSGSTGATNVMRTIGYKAAIIVLIIDILKGAFAVYISYVISNYEWVYSISGISVIIGHIIPIFAKFKGGKGVATGVGAMLLINPFGIIGLIIGILTILISRLVSLGSIVGCISGMIIMLIIHIFLNNQDSYWDLIFFIFATIIILISHHENIRRLINGNESKIFEKNKKLK
jgi:glycerol-3-phosphate acyltransferase PlsY